MPKISSQHGRAIYALLDAAEEEGLMTDERHVQRWRELQELVTRSSYSAEREQLWELFRGMDRAGFLEETWIKAHWKQINAEVMNMNPELPDHDAPKAGGTSAMPAPTKLSRPPRKVLILCTGNSARSIIGEFILRAKGKGRFEVSSAGAKPNREVHPLALWVLKDRYGIDVPSARSKSWEEFKDVHFDYVITVCDRARESCPFWPGHPTVAHWSSPDPAAAEGTDEKKKLFFVQVASQIAQRIDLFCGFPEERIHALALQAIGAKFSLPGITE